MFALAALAAFAVFVLLPVACVLAKALFEESGAYTNVLLDSRQWGLLRNSLLLAGGTSALAGIAGASAAIALTRVPAPWRAVFTCLLAVPVLVPPHIAAIAWVDLLGRNGIFVVQFSGLNTKALTWPGMFHMSGVIWALGISWYPIVMAATLAALSRFDGRLREVARIAGQHRRAFHGIMLPLLLTGIATGMLLVFVYTLVSFAVPSLLQVNTYPVEINALSAVFDYAGATLQALPLAALCALAAILWAVYVRPRHAWLSGRARALPAPASRMSRVAGTAYCLILLFVAVALPLGVTMLRALPLRTFFDVWATAQKEMLTSVFVSSATATFAAALAFLLATTLRRRASGTALALSVLPLGITGGALGLGLIALWNHHGPAGWVYDSLAIVVLGCAARFFIFAYAGMLAGTRRLDPRLDEAAAVAGLSWCSRTTGIALPLLSPYLAAMWGLVFVLTMGEVDTSVLVCPPGETTLSIRLFSLMHYGPDSYVAALSLLTVALVIGMTACAAFGYGRLKAWTHARH